MAEGSGPCRCTGGHVNEHCCAILNASGLCECPVSKNGWRKALVRCKSCCCSACYKAADECNCPTIRTVGPQPPPPPLPVARVDPYDWASSVHQQPPPPPVPKARVEPYDSVTPKLDVNINPVVAQSAPADNIDANKEAADVIAGQIRLSFIGKMNSTFREQEVLISTQREELKDLRNELSMVKARRYDLCSQCGRGLI